MSGGGCCQGGELTAHNTRVALGHCLCPPTMMYVMHESRQTWVDRRTSVLSSLFEVAAAVINSQKKKREATRRTTAVDSATYNRGEHTTSLDGVSPSYYLRIAAANGGTPLLFPPLLRCLWVLTSKRKWINGGKNETGVRTNISPLQTFRKKNGLGLHQSRPNASGGRGWKRRNCVPLFPVGFCTLLRRVDA